MTGPAEPAVVAATMVSDRRQDTPGPHAPQGVHRSYQIRLSVRRRSAVHARSVTTAPIAPVNKK